MIRFGGPVFTGEQKTAKAGESHGAVVFDPDQLANAHKMKGYKAAYAPVVGINEKEKINAIRESFARNDIVIAEVGYWENLMDTDAGERASNRVQMVEALAVAEALGARCAVNILGSFCHGNGNSEHVAKNFTQEAFDEAVDLARDLLNTVKPKTASFAYEIFPFNVVDSPEMIAKLIKAVDHKQFGVHLDLVNLINCPRAYFRSGEIMDECIKLFGDKIVSAHVKDVKMKAPAISVILEEVPAGQGGLDLAKYLRELHKLPVEIPLMMEHLSDEAEYDMAAAHIRKVAKQEKIEI